MTDATDLVLETRSAAATRAAAERLGCAARPGDCLALIGPLGAGKTVIVKGIAAGLGLDPAEVTSPTFVLMTRHTARLPLFHFDAYRLANSSELLAIGAEEAFYGDGVSVVEWADRVADVLPPDRLEIVIEMTGPSERTLRARALGSASRRWLDALRA